MFYVLSFLPSLSTACMESHLKVEHLYFLCALIPAITAEAPPVWSHTLRSNNYIFYVLSFLPSLSAAYMESHLKVEHLYVLCALISAIAAAAPPVWSHILRSSIYIFYVLLLLPSLSAACMESHLKVEHLYVLCNGNKAGV